MYKGHSSMIYESANSLHLKVQYTKYLRFDQKITILKQKYK